LIAEVDKLGGLGDYESGGGIDTLPSIHGRGKGTRGGVYDRESNDISRKYLSPYSGHGERLE